MNLLALLAALLPWAATPLAAVTRIYLAIGLLSLEMQVVTLAGVGSLGGLVPFNAALAGGLALWQARRGRPAIGRDPAWRAGAPWAAVLPVLGLVLLLNASLPLEAADPYHLDRVAVIEQSGTLAYDATVDPKVNVVGWVYELVLADARQVPGIGDALVRLHGVFGLLLYATALAGVRAAFFPGGAGWPWAVLLVVPPLFQQLVLVKNDLFLGVPALLALAWLVAGGGRGTPREAAWAGWLAGFAVAGKLVGFALALVLLAGVAAGARGRGRAGMMAALAAGGAAGALTGGLVYSWVENARWYGDPLASQVTAELGNVSATAGEALVSLGRFAISLVDWGQLTPRWWPGRGGWGGTFGLPLVWALAVLAWRWRGSREARWALASAGACFAGFAALFPDADLGHRLVLAPGLVVMAVAAQVAATAGPAARWARVALVPVLALSAAQVARSAVLYLGR